MSKILLILLMIIAMGALFSSCKATENQETIKAEESAPTGERGAPDGGGRPNGGTMSEEGERVPPTDEGDALDGGGRPNGGTMPEEGERVPPTDEGDVLDGGGRPNGETMPEGGGQASQAKKSTPVAVELVTYESMKEALETKGKVVPYKELSIGATSSGVIENILVSVGDDVEEGDLLYTLNVDETTLNGNSQLSTANQNITSAKLKLEEAQKAYEDTLVLFEKEYVTKIDLEKTESSLKSAKLDYEKAVSNYYNIDEQMDFNLSSAVLHAPISGTVVAVDAIEGQKSGNSDVTIIDMSKLLIETLVIGENIKELVLGDSVKVTYNEKIVNGVIHEIGLKGVDDTDSYTVKVIVENMNDLLRFGYGVDVHYTLKELEMQIVLSKKAILTDAYGDYVYLAVDEKSVKTYVEQGLTQDGMVQVFGDLAEGAMVIVQGQNLIGDGSPVSVVDK